MQDASPDDAVKVPTAHEAQLLPMVYLPAVQLKQLVDAILEANVPAAQLEHAEEDDEAAYVPTAQLAQLIAPELSEK